MGHLFICTFTSADFKILICAEDIVDANELAREYATDSNDAKFNEGFDIKVAGDIDNIHFDCDYVIC